MSDGVVFRPGVKFTLATFGFAAILFATTSVIFAAPPKPRVRATGADATAKASERDRDETKSPSGGRAPARRSRELNDGALPPSEEEALSLAEETRLFRNWVDEESGARLKKLVLAEASERRSHWPEYRALDENRAAAGNIRRVGSGRVVLYTDLPSTPETDQIPEVLDSAIEPLCLFFHIDEKRFENWKINAFLMKNVDAFINFGALDGPPLFLYGYSDRDRIFAKDQGVPYYNRFLLLHELVHTFMHEYFGDLRPRWYSEGTAEFLALHAWNPKKGIAIAQIPVSEEAYPGFGRLRQIKELLATGRSPTLMEILNFEPRDYVRVSTYAWSWALVMFLYNSPKYQEIAEILPYWMLLDDPNALLIDAIGDRWGEFEYDWADFLEQLDYSYDFESTAINYDAPSVDGKKTSFPVVTEIETTRGWQNSGVLLEAGRKYKLTVGGRFNFYLDAADRSFEFEGTGATVEYFSGVPVGRVRAVVVPPTDADFSQCYHFDTTSVNPQESGFRFDAFSHARRSRFGVGEDASGFPEGKAPSTSPQERDFKKRGDDQEPFGAYNALWPWNESVNFNATSMTLEPKTSGNLFLRVNSPSKNLRRHQSSVKIQIKLVE